MLPSGSFETGSQILSAPLSQSYYAFSLSSQETRFSNLYALAPNIKNNLMKSLL
jgi:hypothetical protein